MKLGLSCAVLVMKYGYEKAFSICKKSGFDTVELALEFYGKKDDPKAIYNVSSDEFESYFYNIRKLADNAGLEISSTHGHELAYTPDEEERNYARWLSERDIKASEILGAPICVKHPLIKNNWPDNQDDEEFLYAQNAHFFNHMIPFAEAGNVKIALETQGKTHFLARPHQMRKQFDDLDTKQKTICVDVGHTNEAHYYGGPSVGDVIRCLGKDVTHLHLHDNNGTADTHTIPLFDSRGCIDWPDVFDALDEIDYSGTYNFEVILRHYWGILEEATQFLGKYFRYVVDNKGRVK